MNAEVESDSSETSGSSAQAAGVLMPHDLKPGELGEFAQLVERLGFGTLWIPENSFLTGGVAAAAIALANTNELRVGIGVLPAPTRHPATAAMELATLAHAYPGRLTGGVGLGVPSWVDRMGLLPGKPARFMSDYLGVLRRLLAGEQVSAELEGSAYRLTDIKLAHPVEGGIPLAIGAVGELMLKIAGRAADVAIISTLASPKYVAWAREVTESAAKKADRDAPARVCFVSTSVHADAAEARRLIRHDLAFVLGAMGVCALTTPLGIDDELRELLARPEPLAELMPDEWVDEMAIVGTKNDLVGRVHDYIESGATELVFSPKPATRTLEVLTAVSDALALR